ncbi:MAG: hypothetical protein N0E55_05660, partial [Candidatus Thiodiazotropha taylori]|nr:hypothetical protein [Candidatus Thiodiazotropha taylori]MCW4252173.1 hypothetical protein [Candidatus Thiodiazotropha taylori]
TGAENLTRFIPGMSRYKGKNRIESLNGRKNIKISMAGFLELVEWRNQFAHAGGPARFIQWRQACAVAVRR